MTAPPAEIAQAEQALQQLGGFAPERHILLCAGPDKDKCAPREVGDQAWNYLKKRMGELKLGGAQGIVIGGDRRGAVRGSSAREHGALQMRERVLRGSLGELELLAVSDRQATTRILAASADRRAQQRPQIRRRRVSGNEVKRWDAKCIDAMELLDEQKQAVKAKVLTHRADAAPGAAFSEADTT